MAAFGRYRLIRRVGAGGMAEIWKARVDGPSGFEKTVAIKRILPHMEEDSEFVSMFISEARLAARLVHPNIVQVHDFGLAEDEGQNVHYIAMEYVAGQNASSLMKRLAEKGATLPLGIALYIVAEAAKALSYAHAETDSMGKPLGFVHRDISPQNLMITYRGDVKVADFGIAKAATAIRQTAAGVFKGKVTYMSPEQARTEPLDGRSDLFSLGIVLFELVTGRRLFFGTIEEVFAQMRKFEPPDATRLRGVPEDVQRIIRTALQVAPDDRYQEASEMETDLNRVIAAGGWVTARADLARVMELQFAREIELERKDLAPPDRPKTAVLTNPSLEGFSSDSGGKTPVAVSVGSGGGDIASVTRESPPSPSAKTVAKPLRAPEESRADLSLRKEPVRVLDRDTPPPPARPGRRSVGVPLLLVGMAVGSLLPVAAWQLGLVGSRNVATVTPSPTATTAVPPPTATPTETAVAIATFSVPAPTRAPAATARPVKTPMPATARTPVAARRGWVTVTARPWVEVWIDGKLVVEETPLRRHSLPEGPHQFRFVNKNASFDRTFKHSVIPDRESEISVDTASGKIDVR